MKSTELIEILENVPDDSEIVYDLNDVMNISGNDFDIEIMENSIRSITYRPVKRLTYSLKLGFWN